MTTPQCLCGDPLSDDLKKKVSEEWSNRWMEEFDEESKI